MDLVTPRSSERVPVVLNLMMMDRMHQTRCHNLYTLFEFSLSFFLYFEKWLQNALASRRHGKRRMFNSAVVNRDFETMPDSFVAPAASSG